MKTVLLVEDDPLDIVVMLETLKRIDPRLRVQVERTGVDAVLYMKGKAKFADRENYPLPDAILLDLNIPLFSGLEFLRWLRHGHSHYRHTPVVVVSATPNPDDIENARRLGANAAIIKTPNWRQFTKELRDVSHFWFGAQKPERLAAHF